MSATLLELQHIDKTYRLGDVDVPVLKDVSLTIRRGEFVALMGASGSGKTTLMNLLGCLDQSTAGSYRFGDMEVAQLSRRQLARLRGGRIGFVFQSFNLMPRATALDNVRMPSAYTADNRSRRQLRERSRELLKMVGLESRMDHSPAKLSGGEQQRVAIARALINRPILLLADEPTGNLDSRTGLEILEIFRRLNVEQGITILLVTHDLEVAQPRRSRDPHRRRPDRRRCQRAPRRTSGTSTQVVVANRPRPMVLRPSCLCAAGGMDCGWRRGPCGSPCRPCGAT